MFSATMPSQCVDVRRTISAGAISTRSRKVAVYLAAELGRGTVLLGHLSRHGLVTPRRYAWRRWTLDWFTPNTPGRHTLLARAKDANGQQQPAVHDPCYGSYVINHSLPIEVFVDASA
jgi:hypothetical protein